MSRDLWLFYSLRGLAFAFVVLCDAQIIAHKTIIVIFKRRRKSDAICWPVFASLPARQLASCAGLVIERLTDHTESVFWVLARPSRTWSWAMSWIVAAGCWSLDFYLWPVNATSSLIAKKKPKQTLSFFKAKNVLTFGEPPESTSPHDANLFGRALELKTPRKPKNKPQKSPKITDVKPGDFRFKFGSGFGFRCKLNTLPGKHATARRSDFIRRRALECRNPRDHLNSYKLISIH